MFPLFPQHRSLRRSLPVRKSVRISHGGDISQCHHWDVSFIVAVNLTISLRSSCCGSRGWSNSFLSWMRIHWGLMCAEKYILIRSLIPFYMALFPKSWGYPKSSSRHGWPWLSTETTMVTWGSPMLGTPYLLYFIIRYCNCSEHVLWGDSFWSLWRVSISVAQHNPLPLVLNIPKKPWFSREFAHTWKHWYRCWILGWWA